MNYINANDVIALWRPLTADEIERVEAIIPMVTSTIRLEGRKAGKNADELFCHCPDFKNVCKEVAVMVVRRYLNDSDQSTTMNQVTQSALGYSLTGTFVSAGGGITLLKKELKLLGFNRQRFGFVDMLG